MAIAYLVDTPFSSPLSWASSSGGAGGSFAGGSIPDLTTDVLIDANSPALADADISSKIKSITQSNAAVTITQIADLDTDSFTQTNGDWDTGAFGFNCTNLFSQSNGLFDGLLASYFLVGGLNLTGGSLLGTPTLPTIDTSTDTAPVTILDAISEAALNPKRMRGDEGEVEMRSIDELIKAAKFTANNGALASNPAILFKQLKPSSSL